MSGFPSFTEAARILARAALRSAGRRLARLLGLEERKRCSCTHRCPLCG